LCLLKIFKNTPETI